MLSSKKPYVEILEAEFKRRQGVNSKYSLRSFAQSLGIHSSSLSAILKGKRNLPVNYVESFIELLKLDSEKARTFRTSVQSEQLRIQQIPMPDIAQLDLDGINGKAPDHLDKYPDQLKHYVNINVVTTESRIAGAKKILEEMKAKLYVFLKDIDMSDEELKKVSLSISLHPESLTPETKVYDSVSSSSLT